MDGCPHCTILERSIRHAAGVLRGWERQPTHQFHVNLRCLESHFRFIVDMLDERENAKTNNPAPEWKGLTVERNQTVLHCVLSVSNKRHGVAGAGFGCYAAGLFEFVRPDTHGPSKRPAALDLHRPARRASPVLHLRFTS